MLAAVLVNVPAAHLALTAAQALPSLAAENVAPAVQAAHWRSAVAEPAAVIPAPTAHVAHATQAALPAAALNVPLAQVAHVRSVDAVATLSMNEPAAHGALTAAHALPSLVAENVAPAVQAAHWRSAVAEPAAVIPMPTGHVAHAAHSSTASVVLMLALKVPARQLVHCRSLLAVAAAVVRKPAVHGALTAAHAAPSLVAENVAPAVQAAHWRSAVVVPAASLQIAKRLTQSGCGLLLICWVFVLNVM
jgi:hypothetical protein